MPKPTICVPMDATTKKRLRQLAKRNDQTLAAYVRMVLRNHIERKREVDSPARGAK